MWDSCFVVLVWVLQVWNVSFQPFQFLQRWNAETFQVWNVGTFQSLQIWNISVECSVFWNVSTSGVAVTFVDFWNVSVPVVS